MGVGIVREKCGDILDRNVDAIVVPVYRYSGGHIIAGDGMGSRVYRKAGIKEVSEARDNLGELDLCRAVMTPGFALGNAGHIIHILIPYYIRSADTTDADIRMRRRDIKRCYYNILKCAEDAGLKSISLPVLFTYNMPPLASDPDFRRRDRALALQTAKSEITSFLIHSGSCMDVYIYVQPDPEELINVVEYVPRKETRLSDVSFGGRFYEYGERLKKALAESRMPSDVFYRSRVDYYLCRSIPKDSELAKAINCGRDFISRFRSGKNNKTTSKDRAIALAIAMGITDGYERYEFINCASKQHKYPENERDRLIEELIEKGLNDPQQINDELSRINPDYFINTAVKGGAPQK